MALIVIAEDEYFLAMVLQDALEAEGYETVLAPNGHAALELIRQRRPDLVITDFMMPRMTGLELAHVLQEDAEFSALPILLVTGAQGDIARAHPDLFNVILDKPYKETVLLAHVRRLLDGSAR